MKDKQLIPFGQALVQSGDLDPIYFIGGPEDWVARFLPAYWCFYDAGTACVCADAQDYWNTMAVAAANEDRTWTRGRERRHFRGRAAMEGVAGLRLCYPRPEDFVSRLSRWRDCRTLMKAVRAHNQFGPWIAWKVADMMERVVGAPIDFSDIRLEDMFDSPREAAARYAVETGRQALPDLQDALGDLSAPPTYNRRLGIQEYETILCKWGSTHYQVGDDIRDLRRSLNAVADRSPTADRLRTQLLIFRGVHR